MEASGDVGFGLSLTSIRNKTNLLAEVVAQSLATSACETTGLEAECRDKPAALRLKNVSICLILVAGAIGVSLPLLGRKRRLLPTDGCVFATAKAFAAGVILATGFVHMLPDAEDALGDSCLPPVPWSKFPFSGFVAMVAALMTLVADFVGTQFYERKNAEQEAAEVASGGVVSASEGAIVVVTVAEKEEADFQQMEGEANGMPTHHLESHDHDHFHGHHVSGDGTHSLEQKLIVHAHNHDHDDDDDGLDSHDRHVVVSQVLELGIVSHSVIIGLSLGVSQSPCTIRPLMAALSFHQFFEGFALGGCISQAELKTLSSVIMACFFAITTPMGISIGIGLSSFYNPNSPRALVVEGILDSISAGILIYMALVDLIAADFLSKKMRSNTRLQMLSYIALFSGASLMSMLAIWA